MDYETRIKYHGNRDTDEAIKNNIVVSINCGKQFVFCTSLYLHKPADREKVSNKV